MSLKYKVKLLHANSYVSIDEYIGGEYDAEKVGNLFSITFGEGANAMELAFDRDAIEVIEILAGR